MKKTFYLMRHGQTLFNIRRKIQGACDSPLTEVGIKQALIAKKYFDNLDIDHFYCSTAERASDTLELIIGDQPYTRLKALKERDHGTFEGESEDLNPPPAAGYDNVLPFYGGETTEQIIDRAANACIEFMEKEDHQNVLAVSHAGTCMTLLRHFLNEETDPKPKYFPDGFINCTVLKFGYENKTFTLEEIITHDFSEIME